MEIKRVCALYFSATGNTEKTVAAFAETLAEQLGVPWERLPFTKPAERERDYMFADTDLVVVGTPTYAGKLPNKILPDLKARLHGNGALAAGRPDWDDRKEMRTFAKSIADKVKCLMDIPAPVAVPGDAEAPYYVPKGTDGEPAKFLKAKPRTDLTKCTNCGACARLCPMGAIDPKDVSSVPGTCIKCQACVRKCTKHAKYFDDPAFLSHVAMLEQTFTEPKKNEVFL